MDFLTATFTTLALLSGPELSAVEARTDDYFVAAGTVDNIADDERYNYAGAGVTTNNLYLGAGAIDNTTDHMSTHWQFILGFDVPIADNVDVSYRHLSNCAQICGWEQYEPNVGIDTVSLSVEF